MTTFEIPTLNTDRLRLRAFQATDLDAYAAMQANPEVMRYLVTGHTSTRAEVWRTMATSLGAWALRGYGMWACEKIGGGAQADKRIRPTPPPLGDRDGIGRGIEEPVIGERSLAPRTLPLAWKYRPTACGIR